MRKGRWADWVAVALGVAVGLSWIWHGMLGFSGGLFFVLGLGVVLAAMVSLTRPGLLASEVGVLAGGLLLFALPWMFGFTHVTGAATTAWIGGGAIAILGAAGLVMARAARRSDPELAWGSHSNTVPE